MLSISKTCAEFIKLMGEFRGGNSKHSVHYAVVTFREALCKYMYIESICWCWPSASGDENTYLQNRNSDLNCNIFMVWTGTALRFSIPGCFTTMTDRWWCLIIGAHPHALPVPPSPRPLIPPHFFSAWTREAVYVQRNIEACSRNHCCRGKARSITYSEYLIVALVIQHAKRMPRIIV